MLELDKQYKGFKKYLVPSAAMRSWSRTCAKNFKFLGEMGAYYFLYVVGEKVPDWEEWSRQHFAKVTRSVIASEARQTDIAMSY